MKNYFLYAFLIACLGLPCYGQQTTKVKGTTERPAGLTPKAIVADAGFGTVMTPPAGNRRAAAVAEIKAAPEPANVQKVRVLVEEESLGDIARRVRAEKNRRHSSVVEGQGSL